MVQLPKITVRPGQSIESALKIFNDKTRQSGIHQANRARTSNVSKSARRKAKKKKTAQNKQRNY